MLNVLARDGEDVHVRFNCAQTDEAFSEKFARAEFKLGRVEIRHAFENVLAFADVSPFIGANEIGNMH